MNLYPVDGPWPGQLAVVGRPRSGPWLDDDLARLRTAGFGNLVSLLAVPELERAGLASIAERAAAHGLAFEHFPVANMTAPPLAAAREAIPRWLAALSRGEGLALHCWASAGRAPTVAAGLPAEAAWARLAAARGLAVPDTREQRAWVSLFAAEQAVEPTRAFYEAR